MRISDWSSDVCSSDLPVRARISIDAGDGRTGRAARGAERKLGGRFRLSAIPALGLSTPRRGWRRRRGRTHLVKRGRRGDRKSVVSGTSVSVRVDLGGRRILKNTTTPKPLNQNT